VPAAPWINQQLMLRSSLHLPFAAVRLLMDPTPLNGCLILLPLPPPSPPPCRSYLTSDVSEQGLLSVPCIIGQLAQIFMGAAFAPWLSRVVARKDAAAAAAAGTAAAVEDGAAGLQQGDGASSSSIDTGKGSEGVGALKEDSASELELSGAAGSGEGAVAPAADSGPQPELQQVQVDVTHGKGP
jgi:hypothetical protein